MQMLKRQPLYMKEFPDEGWDEAHVSFCSPFKLGIWKIADMRLPIRISIEAIDGGWEYVIWWNEPNTLDGQEKLMRYFLNRSSVAPDYTFMEFVWDVSPDKWWARPNERIDPRDIKEEA